MSTTTARSGRILADDGTRIAFEAVGSGPALVLTNGLTTTSFFFKYLRPRWAERYTVVTWDLPGHGRSEAARSPATATIEGQPPILARVLDAVEVERATHVGFSAGCQIVLEFAHRCPERCRALIALLGSFRNALGSTALPFSGPLLHALLRSPGGPVVARAVQASAQLTPLAPVLALVRKLHILGAGTSPEDVRELVFDLRRVDSRTSAALACSAERHSVVSSLASLRLPLLIVAGERDRFAPPEVSAKPLARAVPHAKLVILPGATHTALLDHPDAIAREVEDFLAALPEA